MLTAFPAAARSPGTPSAPDVTYSKVYLTRQMSLEDVREGKSSSEQTIPQLTSRDGSGLYPRGPGLQCTPVILGLERLGEEDQDSEASLIYTVGTVFKKTNKQTEPPILQYKQG